MGLVELFTTYIKNDFFHLAENQKKLHLKEEKGTPYEVLLNIDRHTSKFLVIHNLEMLKKEQALYLKQHPKDCDYILMDLIEKVVYLIELKDTDTTNASFIQQLTAGEYWLQHLLFCCRSEGFTKEWIVKRVGIRYDSVRPTKTRRPRRAASNDNLIGPLTYIKEVAGKDLFVLRGKEFRLDSLIRV